MNNNYCKKRKKISFETEFIDKLLYEPNFLPINFNFLKSLSSSCAIYLSILLYSYKYFLDTGQLKFGDRLFVQPIYISSTYGMRIQVQERCEIILQEKELIKVQILDRKKYIRFNFDEIEKLIAIGEI
jgi:hypothetical protein